MQDESHYFRFRYGLHCGTVASVKQAGRADARVIFDTVEPSQIGHGRSANKKWTTPREVAEVGVRDYIERAVGFPPPEGAVTLDTRVDSLLPGQYFPRIWRPCTVQMVPDYQSQRTESKMALRHLDETARGIFGVVEPGTNPGAFGHKIRQLLLLACMEVENSWKAVLAANGALPVTGNGKQTNPNTNHYIKLRDPMNLNLYRVRLHEYPNIAPTSPFECWRTEQEGLEEEARLEHCRLEREANRQRAAPEAIPKHAPVPGKLYGPTASIPWYEAYNKTKHSRSEHFDLATIENALNALAAGWVMHIAQFGPGTLASDSTLWAFDGAYDLHETSDGYTYPLLGETPEGVAHPSLR